MKDMIYIFYNILLPIFLQIGLGYMLQKIFKLDIRTLTRVLIYILIPAIIFLKIYNATLEARFIFQAASFTVLLFILLLLVGEVMAKVLHLSKRRSKAFVNGMTLRNNGNYGIPLMSLLFLGNDMAFSIHMIVLMTSNVLLNTIGLYYVSSGRYSKGEALVKLMKMPILYVMVLGTFMNVFEINLPAPLYSTVDIWSQGMVALALMTLGCQLAETELAKVNTSMILDVAMRLIGSPFIAWLLTLVLGIEGIMAKVLIIGAACPTAVNSVLYSIEFQGDSEYASQIVLYTTLFSALTMTTIIKLVM